MTATRPSTQAERAARRTTIAIAAVGAAVCTLSVVFVARSVPAEQAVARGVTEALVIALPITAGLYALRMPNTARVGLALIATGFAWSLTALGESAESLPYSVGRVTAWLVFPSLIFLMLAFPDGHVARGSDQVLFRALNLVLIFLYIGSALFIEGYPEHTPWATCSGDCPANAFLVLDHEPAVMADVVQPLRETLSVLLFTCAVVSMALRYRHASPLRRRTLLPVMLASTVSVGLLAAFFITRYVNPDGDAVETLGLLWGLGIAGIAAAFLAGLVRRRLMIGSVLARLTEELSDAVDVPRLRSALAAALSDPTLEVLVPDGPVRWRDSQGRPGVLPGREDKRAVTIVSDADGVSSVALVHDDELRADGELLVAVSALVRGTVRHHGVTTKLAATQRELEQSRRRIAEAADHERARIERDLHDGAQQRLMMMRIRLSLAEELLQTDPAAGIDALHEVGEEAERTLDELRSLAHGVYPAILNDRGLEDALRSLALGGPVPIRLQTRALTRLPMEIETAVYFTCQEAVQNAIKHATGASGVWIVVNQGRELTFEVRDDGPGFTSSSHDDGVPHNGLRNMRDRLEAVGGRLTIDSAPGRGTRVFAVVPLDGATSR